MITVKDSDTLPIIPLIYMSGKEEHKNTVAFSNFILNLKLILSSDS